MYKNFNLTESEREQILNQHKEHGYKKSLNEESNDSIGNSEYKWRSNRKPKMLPGDVPLRQQLLFIVDNLNGQHTDDMVTREQMTEVLKQTIENFVNPDDFIPHEEWNKLYYSITNDNYA